VSALPRRLEVGRRHPLRVFDDPRSSLKVVHPAVVRGPRERNRGRDQREEREALPATHTEPQHGPADEADAHEIVQLGEQEEPEQCTGEKYSEAQFGLYAAH